MDLRERLLVGRRSKIAFLLIPTVLSLLAFAVAEWGLPLVAAQNLWTGKFNNPWAAFSSTVLISFAQVCLATLFVTVAYLWLVPKDQREGQLSITHSDDNSYYLKEFLKTTDRYWFRGRSGRWVRESVLPRLAKRAAEEQSTIAVTMVLPDPMVKALMTSYANYRKSISFKGGATEWTSDYVTLQVVTTVVAAYASASTSKFLDLKIGLSNWFSAYRLDITDGSALLTVEDPGRPALRAISSSFMYRTQKTEIEQNLELSRVLPAPPSSFIGKTLDEALVKEILQHVGLDGLLNTSLKVDDILQAIEKPDQPYG